MELQPERMEVSGEKYLVLHQEGVGMANCFMWHLRMGMIAAAVTGRKLVFNWPAVSRNFNTNPDHALIASLAGRAPRWPVRWPEDAALFVQSNVSVVSFFSTSEPRTSPTSMRCFQQLVGSAACSTQGVLGECLGAISYETVLGGPSQYMAARIAGMRDYLGRATPPGIVAPAHLRDEGVADSVVVSLHLRTYGTHLEPGQSRYADQWATADSFFRCAEMALESVRDSRPEAKVLVHFATDTPAYRANATDRLSRFGPVAWIGSDDIRHSRPSKRGAVLAPRADGTVGPLPGTDVGDDNAALDWWLLAESDVLLGSADSMFSGSAATRGCVNGNLKEVWWWKVRDPGNSCARRPHRACKTLADFAAEDG